MATEPKVVWDKTPRYAVVLQTLSGPPDTIEEFRKVFVVWDKQYGVAFGYCNHFGTAIGQAMEAQIRHANAMEIADAQEARGWAPPGDDKPTFPNIN